MLKIYKSYPTIICYIGTTICQYVKTNILMFKLSQYLLRIFCVYYINTENTVFHIVRSLEYY